MSEATEGLFLSDSVLDVLTGLLQVSFGLVALALGLQRPIVRRFSGSFFGLSLYFLRLVLGVVCKFHMTPQVWPATLLIEPGPSIVCSQRARHPNLQGQSLLACC
jgi:hypothetical protein